MLPRILFYFLKIRYSESTLTNCEARAFLYNSTIPCWSVHCVSVKRFFEKSYALIAAFIAVQTNSFNQKVFSFSQQHTFINGTYIRTSERTTKNPPLCHTWFSVGASVCVRQFVSCTTQQTRQIKSGSPPKLLCGVVLSVCAFVRVSFKIGGAKTKFS